MLTFPRPGDKVRWYQIDGFAYPSVTTVLDALPIEQSLREWKRNREDSAAYTKRRQVIGTTVHYRCQCYFYKTFGPEAGIEYPELEYGTDNEKVVLTMEDYDLINLKYEYFLEWVREHKPMPLDVERRVHSAEFGFAGRPDLRARLKDGLIWLVDFKTGASVRKNYPAQLSAYKQAFEEVGKPIDKLGVLNLFPDNPEVHPTFDFHWTKGNWRLFERAMKYFYAQVRNVQAFAPWTARYGEMVSKLEVSA